MKADLVLRAFVVIVSVFIFTSSLVAQTKEVISYTLPGQIPDHLYLGDYVHVLPDVDQTYSIDDILARNIPDFIEPELVNVASYPFHYWMRLQLENTSEQTIITTVSLTYWADSVIAYVVTEGKVTRTFKTGQAMKARDKHLFSKGANELISLDPGQTKTFYFSIKLAEHIPIGLYGINQIGLTSRPVLANFQLDIFFQQGLFSGILLLFGLVSGFLVFVFKERVFLYFVGLMFSFTLYFLSTHSVLRAILNLKGLQEFYFNSFAIAGIVIFTTLFVLNYLRLKDHLPILSGALISFMILVGGCAFILPFTLGTSESSFWVNTGTGLWMLLTISLILIRFLKKDKHARIMLLSISLLFLGGAFLLFKISTDSMSGLFTNGLQLGTIAFSSILFYSLFDRYNVLQAEQTRMEEMDELKSQFFANISHEFRTPLTLMLGPLKQVLEKTKNLNDHALLSIAHQNANRQLGLVNQLLDLAKAEGGKVKLKASEQDFLPLLKGTVYSFSSLVEQRNIQLNVESNIATCPLYIDRQQMEKIIINLVSNACKFTPDGGQIDIKLNHRSSDVELTVTDNGQGIRPDRLPYVFDRFFRASTDTENSLEGHGIGLALVKELVQLHHGTIRLESELGKGTTARLLFPKGKAHLQSHEWSTKNELTSPVFDKKINYANLIVGKTVKESPVFSEKKQVLIIEDNADVRFFIRQRLSPAYNITEAADGEEGVNRAIREMPDLIISDVMMPKMDGYAVCQALKSDVRTCHIPVILLTAKAAQEEKLAGLSTGADDYLTKPFNANELELRVSNLIRLRLQLRQRFATEIYIRPSELMTNSLDQDFLERATKIVETNLADENFNLGVLVQEVGMSRPNLNRKFRALVNQSSNQFIQSIRLQRAAELLKQKSGSIGEIAFQTGFSSTSYFTKSFKDYFGLTPGVFVKRHEE